MSDALVIVLVGALLVAVVALLIVVRRRPSPPPAPFDEEALRRLVENAVSSTARTSQPDDRAEHEPDLSHFALLSHEATAAAEAADAVRRTASEAADELTSPLPPRSGAIALGRSRGGGAHRRGRPRAGRRTACRAGCGTQPDHRRGHRRALRGPPGTPGGRAEAACGHPGAGRRAAGAGRRSAPDRGRPGRAVRHQEGAAIAAPTQLEATAAELARRAKELDDRQQRDCRVRGRPSRPS